MRIIGLHGPHGCGKDLVAEIICEKRRAISISFADAVKDALCAALNIERDTIERMKRLDDDVIVVRDKRGEMWASASRMPMRELLQRFATDMGRNMVGEDIWSNVLAKYIMATLKMDPAYRPEYLVVPDVRFENEVKMLRVFGAQIVEIMRPGCNFTDHVSDTRLPGYLLNFGLRNTGTVAELAPHVEQLLALTDDLDEASI